MKRGKIFGIELLVLEAVLTVGFSIFIGKSSLLPGGWFIAMIAVLVVILGLGAFLILWKDKKARLIVGMCLSLLASVGIFMTYYYVSPAVKLLQQITDEYDEMAKVSAYVLDTDPAQSLQDAVSYPFGILAVMDRTNSDKALDKMKQELGQTIVPQEYGSITELADALTNGQVKVIVVNESLLSVLDDVEGYESFSDTIREINTQKIVIEPVMEDEDTPEVESRVFTVYISGIDGWGGIEAVGRSDVNIIATVNMDTKQILLVSTPRDYFVPLPVSNGVRDKLTHAGIYGVDCSEGALEELYGMDIDYYFRVNFSGFEKIIDALGGIDVYSEYDFTVANWHYQVGMNHLDGLSALAFARERHAFAGGDLVRGQNQMRVIEATLKKCMSPAIISNYTEVLDSVEGSFQTDMPYEVITSFVREQISTGGDWEVQTYGVTGTGNHSGTYSIPNQNLYVMEPDYSTVEQAKEYMQQIRNGESIEIV